MRVGLERRDGGAQLGLADGELLVSQAGGGDQRVELEEEEDVVVADPRRDLVHEVLVAGRDGRGGGVAAVLVNQVVGRQHDRGAGLLELRALQVVRDLAGDVGAHVPHVEAVRAGLGGDVAQERGDRGLGVAVARLGLGRAAGGVDVELGPGEGVAGRPGRERRAGRRIAGLHRIVVEDRDQRVVVGAEAVGPGAVEVGERVHRRRVHPLVDDADVERVGVLAGGDVMYWLATVSKSIPGCASWRLTP